MDRCLKNNALSSYGGWRAIGKVLSLAILCFAAPLRAQDPVPTIVAFGDSLTQGYGLAEPDGFVAQLRAWLDGQGVAAQIINGGVSGDTTAGGLARIDWTLGPEVSGMILALGGNDMLRGIDPALTRANVDAMLALARDRGVAVLLVGSRAPANFGPDYQAQFDAIWPELAQKYDVDYVESFFIGFGDMAPAEAVSLMQADAIHPNAQGVMQIVAGLGPAVRALIKKAAEKSTALQ